MDRVRRAVPDFSGNVRFGRSREAAMPYKIVCSTLRVTLNRPDRILGERRLGIIVMLKEVVGDADS